MCKTGLLFSGVTAAGLQLYNDDGATGTLTFNKIGANQYQLSTGDSAAAHRMFFNSSDGATTWEFKGDILPFTDNTFNLGSASFRFATVYAATGAINTSDERSKQDVQSIDDAEKRVAQAVKGLIKNSDSRMLSRKKATKQEFILVSWLKKLLKPLTLKGLMQTTTDCFVLMNGTRLMGKL